MKYLVISDIHGIKEFANQIPKIIKKEKPDKIIILGDILLHDDYGHEDENSNILIAEMLNLYTDKIIGIRGNIDTEADEKKFDFKLEISHEEMINGKKFYFTHGHMYNEHTVPEDIEILVVGHTHIHEVRKTFNMTVVNPGSISLPRGGSKHSYMVIDDKIRIKDIKGHVIEEASI